VDDSDWPKEWYWWWWFEGGCWVVIGVLGRGFLMKFKLVDTKTTVSAPKALLEAIVGTKGTTKRVRVDHEEGHTPEASMTLIHGLRKHLRKLNLALSTEAGEGYVDLWTTGQPPKPRKKSKAVEAPSAL
jgi:hypothetical protein